MSIGSGLSGSFGWSKESVAYATRVAPAKFIRHKSCTFDFAPNRVQGEGIQSAALGLRGDNDPVQLTNSWTRWIRRTVASAGGGTTRR